MSDENKNKIIDKAMENFVPNEQLDISHIEIHSELNISRKENKYGYRKQR